MVEAVIRSEGKPVILVADDDEMQRFLLGEALEAEGFQVEVVADGLAAVERAEILKPDVVLLDVVMPGMDGYAACSALRMLPFGDGLPIVMVTGQDDLDSIARAYDAGATDFIVKPLNWTLLRHRIRYVYRAGSTLKQLQASEARLAEAQRIAQLGSWEWTVGNDHVWCSPEVFRIFGLPGQPGDPLLTKLLEPIHPDDRKAIGDALNGLGPQMPTFASEFRLKATEGGDRVIAVHAHVDDDHVDGQQTLKGTFQDVTERHLAEARLYHLAHHDSLTGLPNRSLFQDRLGQALERAKREGVDVATFCIDIYRFKDINDTFGHRVGDRLLQQIAVRLQSEVRGADTVAHLSGDEFAVAQVGLVQPSGAERLSQRLFSTLSHPFEIDGQEIFLDACIGVAIGPYDASESEQLLVKADIALHRAKADSPGTCCFFEGGMDVAFKDRKTIENDLRRAISDGWFELHYQPQIDIDREVIVGVEALLRLRHPEKGLMMPDKFIGIAEETGLIVPIGTWVLRTACQQAMTWQKNGLPALRVAVNLSPLQFQEANFTETIVGGLTDSGLDATLLEVEITENILIRDTATVIDVLHKLKELGVQIAMDDFGTGYSSLGYLQRFPFDRIKIDRSFINEMSDGSGSAAIVGAVIALSKRLKMATTAEGIETREQLDYLRNEGCDEAQGFYFGRPMPAADLIKRIGNDLPIGQETACFTIG
ncbi:MAG: putative bifunctional diguanylate cyclase/phosphodiesterase [Geminicoccaceae bacterium]